MDEKTPKFEELDHRESNGIAVTLLWDRRTNDLLVRVYDAVQDEEFELACAPHEALEVFTHPFAYAARRRVRHRDPITVAPA